MNEIRVFLTPEMANPKILKDSTCVVVDILRATSSWVTAIGNGAKLVRPVTTLKECKSLKSKGFLTAAERGGQKIEGFDLGNSPLEYTPAIVTGKKIAVTTTNGSRSIKYASAAKEIYIGAYLNLKALNQVLQNKGSVVVICSGWEGQPGIEDVIFAGEIVSLLSNTHVYTDDAALIAFELYKKAKQNMYFFLSQAIHVKRLLKLGLKKDIDYCLKKDEYDIVPRLNKDDILSR
jgi:2-phosphosulfolactate phosphatase